MSGDDDASLRVLHVITDRDRRGAQVFAVDLAEGLRAIGVENDVVALAGGHHGDLLDLEALGPRRRSLRTLHRLRRRAHGADVVVAHGSATLLACSTALVGTGVPFVYRQISDPLHWAPSWSRRLRVALLLRRAKAVVALADSVADVFATHYRLDRRRITVLPNAVPTGRFAPATPSERADARDRLGLPPDQVVAAYIGALAVEKGVRDLAEAARSVPGLTVLVVGDGPEHERLAGEDARLAPGQLVFTGALADPSPALQAADMVVLPSRGGDSMPAVLIEAGLCGLPTVTTPVGAIPEVVIDGETGLITPIADVRSLVDALQVLAGDVASRERMGTAARQRCIALFSIGETAPEWKALLTSIVRGR